MMWSVAPSIHARLIRGAVLFSAAALLVGGLAGTLQWPIVGTFFEALSIGRFGPVIGVVIAAVTSPMASHRWLVRCTGGIICFVAALHGVVHYAFQGRSVPLFAWSLVTLSVVLGVVLAPMVASGAVVTSSRHGESASELFTTIISRGAVIGAVIGAVVGLGVGLGVGLYAFAPTAPFAVIEGAIFGTVSSVIVALVIAAVVLLPRVKVGP